jgi:molybdopterin molybdotransferase
MTGAAVPGATEAIVPMEEARIEQSALNVEAAPKTGAHLRRRGEVFRAGELLLARGTPLSPENILLAATVGADPVSVFRLPRCAVLVTGSEIVPATAIPGEGKIRNGNGPALVAALARCGVDAEELAPVEDRPEDLVRLFSSLAGRWDLVLTTGGVSAGDFDHTASAAEQAGFEILFHRVSIKPGKPVAFGKRGTTFWLGLPGNPVSALTTFEIFGRELLARLGGKGGREATARLGEEVSFRGEREIFRDCRLTAKGSELRAEPLPSRGSHDILSQSKRNALLHLPAGGGTLPAGAKVSCLPLDTLPE